MPTEGLVQEIEAVGSKAFRRALVATRQLEGLYSNNPKDPGGRTAYGIAERYHPDLWENGPPSSKDCAQRMLVGYWMPLKLDAIDSVLVQLELFDTAVNLGFTRAARWLQQAYNVLRRPDEPPLVEDAVVGPVTIRTINSFTVRYAAALVNEIDYFQAKHYNEQRNRTFIRGWMGTRIGNARRAMEHWNELSDPS